MPGFAAILDHDPPSEHKIFGDRQDPLGEHRANLVCEPIIEIGAATWFPDQLDAEADFSEGCCAHVEQIERLCRDESYDFGFWFWSARFGQDVGIEKPTCH